MHNLNNTNYNKMSFFLFQMIDKTDDNGAGDVEVNMTSPNSSAVGIKFSSTPGKIMAYEIQIYLESL